MAKKDCTTCELSEWELKKGGRRDLEKGVCIKPVTLPNAFMGHYGELPTRRLVSKYTKEDCPCWVKI